MGVTFLSETLSGAFLSYSLVRIKKMASTSSTVILFILSACSLMRATAITDWDTPYANAVTKATNEYRQSQGLEPLTLDSWLTSTAQEWADHLATSCQFDHRPLDSWPENARAENIISGCEFDPKGSVAVMGWKNSPGHNENVLPRNEAASSSVRLLGTRMSRRQRLQLQCMESHSLTLRVLEWIPLRLL